MPIEDMLSSQPIELWNGESPRTKSFREWLEPVQSEWLEPVHLERPRSVIKLGEFVVGDDRLSDSPEEQNQKLFIQLGNKKIAELPIELKSIYDSIEDSKYILDFEDNWDDEGSPAFKQSTWISAVKFIAKYSLELYNRFNKIIETPNIINGASGSIDILWQKENFRLLINIPESSSNAASFYGDDLGDTTVKGTFSTVKYHEGLLNCLLPIL